MDFNTTLEQFQKHSPDVLMAALKEVEQVAIDAGAVAKAAYVAYFEDVQSRELRLSERVAALTEQQNLRLSDIASLVKQLTRATIEGDTSAMDNVREAIRQLEGEKAQTASEIETLKEAFVTGDKTLYDDTLEKEDRFQELRAAYLDARRQVYALAETMADGYGYVRRNTLEPYGGGRGADTIKLRNHYDAEKLSAINARLSAEEAAIKAAEAARPRSAITATYYTPPEPIRTHGPKIFYEK